MDCAQSAEPWLLTVRWPSPLRSLPLRRRLAGYPPAAVLAPLLMLLLAIFPAAGRRGLGRFAAFAAAAFGLQRVAAPAEAAGPPRRPTGCGRCCSRRSATICARRWVGLWASADYLACRHITAIYNTVSRYSLYLLIALAVVVAA